MPRPPPPAPPRTTPGASSLTARLRKRLNRRAALAAEDYVRQNQLVLANAAPEDCEDCVALAAAAQAADKERQRGSLLARLPPRARSTIALMQVKACTALLAALERLDSFSPRSTVKWPTAGSRRTTVVLAGVVLGLAVMILSGHAVHAPVAAEGRSRILVALATAIREMPRPFSIRMQLRMVAL